MTEQIKSAISELETIRDNYDWRDYVTDESYDDCLNKAIRSLKAWEEVIKELEEMKCEYDCTTNEFQRGANAGANFIRNKAIDIINQHLAEIKEVR